MYRLCSVPTINYPFQSLLNIVHKSDLVAGFLWGGGGGGGGHLRTTPLECCALFNCPPQNFSMFCVLFSVIFSVVGRTAATISVISSTQGIIQQRSRREISSNCRPGLA